MFFRGRISYFTHPPETHTLPTHVSAEIVSEMGKAFDWDELEKGNEEILAGKLKLGISNKTDQISLFVSLFPQFNVGMSKRSPINMVLFFVK